MPTPFEIADAYVDDRLAASPLLATKLGHPGSDHLWDDTSPRGAERHAALDRALVADLAEHRSHPDPIQRLAAEVLIEYADHRLVLHEAGEHLRDLSHLVSRFQSFWQVFEYIDPSDPHDADAAVARLEGIGGALEGYIATLRAGVDAGVVTSRRQVESVIEQADHLAGPGSAWSRLIELSPRPERTAAAVEAAKRQLAPIRSFLAEEYLPASDPVDAVGLERYLRASRGFLGTTIDPDECYEWGWGEIERLLGEMRSVAARIDPAVGLRDVLDRLESDPAVAAPSREAFVEYIAGLQQVAVEQLAGVHFDVPEEIRRVDVAIAAPGGGLGAYYRAPSEDFTRPGCIYYSVGADTVFPLYQEVSAAYHEGFPGHHLQLGTSMARRDSLSRAHRSLVWYSGYGEGWAMYAERLMGELGYFDRPEWELGMLASQLFRAARVVVDIGLHLGLAIPDFEAFPHYSGETWHHDLSCRFMQEVGLQPGPYAASEVTRYLGWPGQAISYKIGEREILRLRDTERNRRGEAFDLRAFHSTVLDHGEMGLDLLADVVAGSFST